MKKSNIWLDGIMGFVVGDALGVPVEFLDREELLKHPVEGMRGYGTYNLPEGSWSDDTSMTLATVHSLKKGFNLDDMMKQFVLWLTEGQYTPYGEVFDVGNTCLRAITRYMINRDVRVCGYDKESDNGNGSLMRILPVCLHLYEKQSNEELEDGKMIEQIHETSALTHAHLRSKIACGIYYYMVRSIIGNKAGGENNTKKSLNECLQDGIDEAFDYYEKDMSIIKELCHYERIRCIMELANIEESSIDSHGYVVTTLEAALWCLVKSNSYKDAMLKAVNLGNDTDTIAAIAGGLAGLYYGYENIPDEWLQVVKRRKWIEEVL